MVRPLTRVRTRNQLPEKVIYPDHLSDETLALLQPPVITESATQLVLQNVLCDTTLAVNELVYLLTDATPKRSEHNTHTLPICGLVINKPDDTHADILLKGFYQSVDPFPYVLPGTRLYVGLTGLLSSGQPKTGYIQFLGQSLTNSLILFFPDFQRIRFGTLSYLQTFAGYDEQFAPVLGKSLGAAAEWNMGDGSVYNTNSPVHFYQAHGSLKHVTITLPDNDYDAVTEFSIQHGWMVGALPVELTHFPEIRTIRLAHNLYGGYVPPEWKDLIMLRVIRLEHNRLHGYIPSEVAALDDLEDFSIASNMFSEEELSTFVNDLWNNRVILGINGCSIDLSDNNGLTANAIDQIQGTGLYTGDGIVQAGCSVSY